MTNAIITYNDPDNHPLLQIVNAPDSNPSKRERQLAGSRIRLFIASQTDKDNNPLPWYKPNLAKWRNELLDSGKAPATVVSYLSTVRTMIKRLIGSNDTRDVLLAMAQADYPDSDAVLWIAMVNESITRMQNGIAPHKPRVKVVTVQDESDSAHLRLTKAQAEALLAMPDRATMKGIRDCAMLALVLCTGIREHELVSLTVVDLRQSLGGKLALRVRYCKRNKQRLIPYGALDWCLTIVDTWLESAGITAGESAVFRGVHRGGRVRVTQLTTRTVERVIAQYPIAIDGKLTHVKPNDMRMTYARRLYDAGVDVVAIQQNLGHSSVATTLKYIGTLDADKREPELVYYFDVSKLKTVQVGVTA